MINKPSRQQKACNLSMHMFFNPKLSLQGRNMLPQISDLNSVAHGQNFFTILKKPIVSAYDKLSVQKQRKQAAIIISNPKQSLKRNQTTQAKYRHKSNDFEEQFLKQCTQVIYDIKGISKCYPKIATNKVKQAHEKEQNQKYYYYIGQGNNSQLIQKILEQRSNWHPTSSSLYHFRWQQKRTKYQSYSFSQQLLNHLPNHQIISDKVGLINNLKTFCEKNEEYLFSFIPVCFYLDFGNQETCENEIKRFVQFYYEQQSLNLKKFQVQQESQKTQSTRREQNQPKSIFKNKSRQNMNQAEINKNFRTTKKFPNIPSIENTRKKQQIKNYHRTLLAKLKSFYSFIDMSPPKKESSFISPTHFDVYGNTQLWLLKPADLNRGRGIHLFRSIEELGDLLKGELVKNDKGSFILQKYIEKPMLINKRKFDIRMYSLITQKKELYFFQQGYIRTSSQLFDVNSPDYFTHLTNNAIQKHSKTYGEFEESNILPLHYLFHNCQVNKINLYDEVKRLIKISTKAGFSKMFSQTEKSKIANSNSVSTQAHLTNSSNGKTKYFEIFGYDFMIDVQGHIWLIEVNTNPCIELSNGWLKNIIPRMLDDAFKLTLDRIFPRGKQNKENPEEGSCFSVPNYEDEEIMWEKIELNEANTIEFQTLPVSLS